MDDPALQGALEIVRAEAADAEARRRVSDRVVRCLRDAGALRMAVPSEFGGSACSLPVLLQRLARLGEADSSAAWLVMVWTQAKIVAARLSRSRYVQLVGRDPDAILAATSAGEGTAAPVCDGFAVSGHWRFASGSSHATSILVHCLLQAADHPRTVGVLLDRQSVNVDDTWATIGLRATASNGVHADGVVVPADSIYELDAPPCRGSTPHSQLPIRAAFALHMAAVALGNATAAFRCDRDGVSGPADAGSGESLLALETSRLALQACATDVWQRVEGGVELDDPTIRWMAALGAHTVQTALTVTLDRYRSAGSQVIFEGSSLQRRLRDVLTMTQHANVSARVIPGIIQFNDLEAVERAPR